ncbi:hypothetical protein CK203_101896 [Vitis vinifera]|uniref:Uncharacterized protein n=1 Tax=Vitis vinifera TaxID=29760 RepID=A0A438DII0_VITVI|nr:hypothetical protein CK203_101896 [Vitis vinifera]
MDAQRGNHHERVLEIHSSMGPVDTFDNSPLHLTVKKLNASQKWQSKNSFITSCLINSMKPAIGKTYMLLPTAKDVWDEIRETYSNAENASQIFEIKTRLWQMKQGDREFTEYYTEMLGLWQDLDLSCEEEWECTGTMSRVLSRRSLPSIREVFSKVRQEESRRRVMLDLSFGPEGSALLTHGPHGPHGPLTVARRGPHAGSSGPHPARSSGPSPRQSKRLILVNQRSNCSAKFLPSHCVFQDLSSGKMIDSAKEREGLYYFDETKILGQSSPTVCNSTSYPKDSEILLWHKKDGSS